MNSSDENEQGKRTDQASRRDDASESGQPAEDAWKPATGPEVIETNDPAITSGPRQAAEWRARPDSTTVVETNQVKEPATGHAPGLVIVPYKEKPTENSPPRDDPDSRDEERNDQDENRDSSKGRKNGGSGSKGIESSKQEHQKSRPSKKENKNGAPNKNPKDRRDQNKPETDQGDARYDAPQEPSQSQPSMTRILLLAGLVALVCGVGGAWAFSHFLGNKNKTDDQKQTSMGNKKSGGGSEKEKSGSSKKPKGSNEEETGSASNEADTIPGFTTADDADSLRKQVGHLAERIDALQQRLDHIQGPRDQTPPDVHTLQIKIGELSRTMDEVADLPSRVQRINKRLEDLSQQIKIVKDREKAREDDELNKPVVVVDKAPNVLSSSPAPFAGSQPLTAETETPDAALEQAIQLFKLGQYPIAANILAQLRKTHPEDARVWYFSALANGLTTGQWDGSTRQFAEKGAQREREGTPPRSVIDRSLDGVTRTQGSDWLRSFRGRMVRQS
jgi:TolA-binding protein